MKPPEQRIINLKLQAQNIPRNKRIEIIQQMKEPELHPWLKELFCRINSDYMVEITHGARELGKDLVIIEKHDLWGDRTTAVIVKMGSIKGIRATTDGDIDKLRVQIENVLDSKGKQKFREVESQIKQAKCHPAELRNVLKTLKVDDLMVVIAGEISNNVRRRFEGELAKHFRKSNIWDMNELVEQFTEHYPEIFFSKGGLESIVQKIQELEEKHQLTNNQSTLNLSEYFTKPVLAEVDFLNFSSESLEDSLEIVMSKRRKIAFSYLSDEVKKSKKLIIYGDQGTGKSSGLAKFVIDELQSQINNFEQDQGNVFNIPIVVSALDVLESNSIDELKNKFMDFNGTGEILKINLLAVDALDEVPFEERDNVLEKIEAYIEQLEASVVITSRRVNVLSAKRQGYEELEILPFKIPQALDFLEKILGGNQDSLRRLEDGLRNLSTHLPLIPLSLKMLAELAESARESGEIPVSITELYTRYFELALGRDDISKGINVLFDHDRKHKLLGKLAYEKFFRQKSLRITLEDFRDFLHAFGQEYLTDWSKQLSENMIQEIQRAGILRISDKEVSFSHKTYLEYFVASYLNTEYEELGVDINQLLSQLHVELDWSDVTFFYIGLRKKLSKNLFTSIKDYNDTDRLRLNLSKVQIGRLLQAGWHSKNEIKCEAIDVILESLPKLREPFINIIQKDDEDTPRLLGDIFVHHFADGALGSITLKDHLMAAFKKQQKVTNQKEGLAIQITLIRVLRKLVEPKELSALAQQSLTSFNNLVSVQNEDFRLDAEEKMRMLILLESVKLDDPMLEKEIRKKCKRFIKNTPGIARALLPFPNKKR